MDLWSRALESLDPCDKEQFQVLQNDPQKVIDTILKDAQAKRDATYKKRWRISKSNGSTIILRDVFEKIVRSISKYAQAVDVVVNTAPMYAAPPWAAVRFLLQVKGPQTCHFQGRLISGLLT